MTNLIVGAGIFSGMLRSLVLVIVGMLAIVCLCDWLVRTRRINPFNPVARFLRSSIDPLIRPIEQRVVRAGGLPSSAPWWALGVAVVAGLILITAVDFIVGQISLTVLMLGSGPRGILTLLIQWTFLILRTALLVRVIVSWLPISPFSPWVRWAFAITEPLLRPMRQFIPSFGMLDLTPLILYFVLGFVETALLRLGGMGMM